MNQHANEDARDPDVDWRSVSKRRVVAEIPIRFLGINILLAGFAAGVATRSQGWWLPAVATTLVVVPMVIAFVLAVTSEAWLHPSTRRGFMSTRDLAIYTWLIAALAAGLILYWPVTNFLTATL